MNIALPKMAYYFRYRNRGGAQPFGDHFNDFHYISPNHHNMSPGSTYRHYFHANVSCIYNSLARRCYRHIQPQPPRPASPTQPLRARNLDRPTPPPRTPPSSPPTDGDQDLNDVRTQTHPQDVPTGLDDQTAVLDSGAMMATVPTRLILGTPGTTIRYGKMEVEHIEQISSIGSYQTQLVQDSPHIHPRHHQSWPHHHFY